MEIPAGPGGAAAQGVLTFDGSEVAIEIPAVPLPAPETLGGSAIGLFTPGQGERKVVSSNADAAKIFAAAVEEWKILTAAALIGLSQEALTMAATYACERVAFDQPIGANQGIAHPLARCWMNLEAADLMVMKAASLYDRGLDCAAAANAAKYLAGEAAFEACETAVMTHGGMGYSREFHVERYLREVMIPRIAPITPHMILNFIAEKVLGLPKSY